MQASEMISRRPFFADAENLPITLAVEADCNKQRQVTGLARPVSNHSRLLTIPFLEILSVHQDVYRILRVRLSPVRSARVVTGYEHLREAMTSA
jgi:hypothetical protein